MFAKTSISTAVAAAFGVAAVGVANADTLFFPYAPVSDSVATVVSVINTSDKNWSSDGAPVALGGVPNLHYRYYYKNVVPVENGKIKEAEAEEAMLPCEEYNEYLPTSKNDIQTIDLSGHFGVDTAGVLFGDPSINNKWQQTGRDYALGRSVVPARGYLTVDNNDADGDSLVGEAFIFEFVNGSAFGYEALRNSADSFDYHSQASRSPANVALMPFNEITTSFFVTPVGLNQAPDAGNNYMARVEIATSGRGDLYDRDENLISGTVPYDVTCVARVPAADLLSDAARSRVVNGGWGKLYNYRLTKDSAGDIKPANFGSGSGSPLEVVAAGRATDAGAIVIKLDYKAGEKTFNGESVGGTYNNSVLIGQ